MHPWRRLPTSKLVPLLSHSTVNAGPPHDHTAAGNINSRFVFLPGSQLELLDIRAAKYKTILRLENDITQPLDV